MNDLDVSYLRVSTQTQAERESIASQRHALVAYCERHAVTIHQQFEDNGVSGGIPIHQRPRGSELYKLVGERRVRRLFTFALDRIGRDVIDSLLFLRHAENNGVQVVGISDGVDTQREGSQLEVELRSVIASQFRRDRVRQTKSGLRRRANEGKVSNRAPFGFTVNADGKLEIDEVRANVVREIFSSIARGERTREIVCRLNSVKAPSPTGRGWRHDTMLYLARHSAFKGEYQSFITPRRNPAGGKRTARDPSERVLIECPCIVSPELFAVVQQRIDQNRQWDSARPKRFYLLRGLITCGKCGRSYVGHAITGRRYGGKKYADFVYYECATLCNRDYQHCGNARIDARRLEAIVWNQIEGFILEPSKVLEQLAKKCNLMGRDDTQRKRKRLELLMAKNGDALHRLTLAVARGVVEDQDAERARDTLKAEAAQIEKQLSDLEVLATNAAAERRQLRDAESMLVALRDKVDYDLKPHDKVELVRRLVGQIVVRDEKPRPQVAILFVCYPSFRFGAVGSSLSDSSRKR